MMNSLRHLKRVIVYTYNFSILTSYNRKIWYRNMIERLFCTEPAGELNVVLVVSLSCQLLVNSTTVELIQTLNKSVSFMF